MGWDGGIRVFKYCNFEFAETKEIEMINKRYGQIGFCKMTPDAMIIVRKFRTIENIDLETGKLTHLIGKHCAAIVAIIECMLRNKAEFFSSKLKDCHNFFFKLSLRSILL